MSLDRDQWLAGQTQGLRMNEFDFPPTPEPLDFGAIRARRDQHYMEVLAEQDVLIEGVEEVLNDLGREFQLGMVTTASREILAHIHSGSSFLDHFDHIVAADDCTRHKPDPEPYERALALFGVPAGKAVAIEDSVRGLNSALAAGLPCLVVRSEFMKDRVFKGAAAVLASIREIPGALPT